MRHHGTQHPDDAVSHPHRACCYQHMYGTGKLEQFAFFFFATERGIIVTRVFVSALITAQPNRYYHGYLAFKPLCRSSALSDLRGLATPGTR